MRRDLRRGIGQHEASAACFAHDGAAAFARNEPQKPARLDGVAEAGFVARMKYRITLVESEEGWAVWCNDLPGCCSQGETREEAVENIRIAIKEWLEAAEDELRADPNVRNIAHEEVLV